MGLAQDLAARAAEFYAEQHRKQKRAANALPGAIAKEWEQRKPDVFKEASGGKTEMSVWIAHPAVRGGAKNHTMEEMAAALPEELAEMYNEGLLKLDKSASCSRSWRLCFNIFDLTNKLTKEYVARDEAEEEAAEEEARAAKRVKRHCGDEGDF
jgi:hypothetical protein